MAVIGAGVIGSEYASTFAALGTNVWVIDGRDVTDAIPRSGDIACVDRRHEQEARDRVPVEKPGHCLPGTRTSATSRWNLIPGAGFVLMRFWLLLVGLAIRMHLNLEAAGIEHWANRSC